MGTVGIAIIGVVGIFAPIAWDFYKGKTGLELQQLGKAALVGGLDGVDKLHFIYDGKRVSSLTKLDFSLVNTGRAPIRAADVVEPVRLKLQNGSVLDVSIRRTEPPNVNASATLESTSTVTLTFPLLNPSDQVFFSVLASEAPAVSSATARIVGIRELQIVDRTGASRSLWSRVRWTVYLVAVFTILCGLFFAVSLHGAGIEAALLSVWRSGVVNTPRLGMPEEFQRFLDVLSQDNKSDELEAARAYLSSLQPGMQMSDDQRTHLLELVDQAMSDQQSIKTAVWLFFFLFLVGLMYVFRSFLAIDGVA